MIDFRGLTRDALEALLEPKSKVSRAWELSPSQLSEKKKRQAKMRASQLMAWVYERGVMDFDQMSDLPQSLRDWLKEELAFSQLEIQSEQNSEDGTLKVLWNLKDKKTVESVLIPAAVNERGMEDFSGRPLKLRDRETWDRYTVCISSQVGCAMGCGFCLTGIQGLDRHLQTHEIVAQVHELKKQAALTNIVFMGMGEPLHNLDNVIAACRILTEELGFSKRRVTVSTSGIVPAIQKLGETVDVSLAISLNASDDKTRDQIMPVNRKWNLSELMKACRDYPLGKQRSITFEYVLLKGINDTLEDTRRIARLLRGIPSKVNLIPLNEHPGSEFKRPSSETIQAFQQALIDQGVFTTVRISRGRDILAACGQLRSLKGTARGSERHKDWA